MQKRKVDRIDVSFVALQVVATFVKFDHRPVLSRHGEKFIIRQQRRIAGPQVSENYSAGLFAGIGSMANRISMLAAPRLPRLLQTTTFNIVEPTVIEAPESPVLDSPVTEIRSSVGTVQSEQPWTAMIVAEQNQLLAEYFNFDRRPALGQFLRQSHRLPIPSQKPAAGSFRTDLGE
jgi:hypothetical protein